MCVVVVVVALCVFREAARLVSDTGDSCACVCVCVCLSLDRELERKKHFALVVQERERVCV